MFVYSFHTQIISKQPFEQVQTASNLNSKNNSSVQKQLQTINTAGTVAPFQQYTREQFQSFMSVNDLTHLIRGHYIDDGSGDITVSTSKNDLYKLNFDGQCITIGSNSVTPMVVFLDPGKKLQCKVPDVPATIRLIKLDPLTI